LIGHLVDDVLVGVHCERYGAVTEYCAGDCWVYALFEHNGGDGVSAVVEPGLRVESCEFHESLGCFAESVRVEWAAIAAVADQVVVVPRCTGLESSFGLFTFGEAQSVDGVLWEGYRSP